MTVWTILIITFGEQFDGYESYLPYRDSKTCGEQIEPMRREFERQGLDVKMVRCRKTSIPSGAK